MTPFDTAFDRVFTNEGGFQKDPKDRGNWTTGVIGEGELKGTKFGISAMTYPELDIKNLTIFQAKVIYKRDWWDKLSLGNYRPGIAYQMFDAAINHGMYTANRMLQFAVGVKADGNIGPITREAVSKTEINDLLMCFLAERLVYMTDIKTWERYGKGWARRVAHNLKLATKDN